MNYTTDNKKITEVLDQIEDLNNLLTERIADLHEGKGMMQARHAYVFYRERLWGIKEALLDALTEVDDGPKSKK